MTITDSNPVIRQDLHSIIGCNLELSPLRKKKILITGGAGLLGSYLVKTLLVANDIFNLDLHVILVSRKYESVQKRMADFLRHARLSIVIHDITQELPSDFPSASIIIHCASQASPKYYGSDPVGTLMANTAGTMHLLNHALACKSSRFLFFSSGEVYGITATPHLPIAEADYGYLDPTRVRSCYAESKRMGETMCAAWSHQYGLHTSIVRPFHTYGPGIALDDGRVFADFVADVVYGRDIVLKSDGLAKRPFCYIADATLGFLTVLLKGSSGEAYNVANPSAEVSMRGLAYTLAGLYPDLRLGVKDSPSSSDKSYLKSPICQSRPCIAKISELGWVPCIGIEEGFSRTIESYHQQCPSDVCGPYAPGC